MKEENSVNKNITQKHKYKTENKTSEEVLPNHLWDHNYSDNTNVGISIDQQFADDVGYADSNEERVDKEVEDTNIRLSNRNLIINKGKTEKYKIDGTEDNWKKCKYLGSCLDTMSDFARRKQLSNVAYNSYKTTLESKKLSLKTKVRLFRAYIESIFLYNSEIWTTSKKLENDIDVFQRNLLRRILKIRYPYIISNEDLYKRTELEPWSLTIKKRRLRWLGHLMRLDESTPVRRALEEATRKGGKKKRGNHKTWVKIVNEDLSKLDPELALSGQKLKELVKNRDEWNGMIKRDPRTGPTTGGGDIVEVL